MLGCATPYKTPCQFNVTVTLARNTREATRLCRERYGKELRHDNGSVPTDSDRFDGCSSPDGEIVVIDDDETIGHEMRHLFDWNCYGD